MPMTWNAEADSKLLVGILQVFDLKFNKEIMDKLNAYMGPECSGQSITSRIAKLKKSVGATSGSVPSTPKTPRTAKGTKRKRTAEDDASLSDDEETPVKERGSKTPKPVIYKVESDEDKDKDSIALGMKIKEEVSIPDQDEDGPYYDVVAV